jgi:hypothetical protein
VNLAARLAEYYARQTYTTLPKDVAAKGAEHIAYMLMLALRGHRNTEEAGQAIALAKRLSDRGGTATIVGASTRVQPIDAAFANTTLMRALEIDDVMFPIGVHTGLVTTPPALAVAETQHRSGADLIAGRRSGLLDHRKARQRHRGVGRRAAAAPDHPVRRVRWRGRMRSAPTSRARAARAGDPLRRAVRDGPGRGRRVDALLQRRRAQRALRRAPRGDLADG